VGGHAYTVMGPSNEYLDVGYMVMNLHTYPNLLRIFAETGVELEESDMSFSCWSPQTDSEEAWSWSFKGGIDWMVRNVWRPRLWKFAIAHAYFSKVSSAFLANPHKFSDDPHLTLRQLIALVPTLDDVEGCVRGKALDPIFVNKWLVPFVSAVWSAPENNALDCAALSILRFMNNHQFLTLGTMQWYTPKARAHTYVEKVLAACKQLAHQHASNLTIKTGSGAVALKQGSTSRGSKDKSAVILANGDKISYALLAIPPPPFPPPLSPALSPSLTPVIFQC
jgi:predicted NAD/FAD-binding protein